jgi:hypothetical protein
VTQLTWRLIPCQLSQGWENLVSTKSKQDDEIFNIWANSKNCKMLHKLQVDQVGVKSHSALTESMRSLPQHWPIWQGVSPSVAQCAEDELSRHWHTRPALPPLKGHNLDKIIHEMFKWVLWTIKCFIFFCADWGKNNSAIAESSPCYEYFEYLGEF